MLELVIGIGLILIPFSISTLINQWAARKTLDLTLSLTSASILTISRSLIVLCCGFAIDKQLTISEDIIHMIIQVFYIILTIAAGLVAHWLLFNRFTDKPISFWGMTKTIALENSVFIGLVIGISLVLSITFVALPMNVVI